jgi:hypothetical protein
MQGVALAAVLVCVASYTKAPCPSGQDLREEKFPDSPQVKARGCIDRDAKGNDRLQGKWEWFYKSGQKEAEGVFKDGFVGGEKDETGIPKSGREGSWTFWHDNGQKESAWTFKAGKVEGAHTHWYKNGKKKAEGTAKDGTGDGPYTQCRSITTWPWVWLGHDSWRSCSS